MLFLLPLLPAVAQSSGDQLMLALGPPVVQESIPSPGEAVKIMKRRLQAAQLEQKASAAETEARITPVAAVASPEPPEVELAAFEVINAGQLRKMRRAERGQTEPEESGQVEQETQTLAARQALLAEREAEARLALQAKQKEEARQRVLQQRRDEEARQALQAEKAAQAQRRLQAKREEAARQAAYQKARARLAEIEQQQAEEAQRVLQAKEEAIRLAELKAQREARQKPAPSYIQPQYSGRPENKTVAMLVPRGMQAQNLKKPAAKSTERAQVNWLSLHGLSVEEKLENLKQLRLEGAINGETYLQARQQVIYSQ
ncbi:MAG: hypothetical protein ACPHER_10525 [Nevskiales bacterium]